MGLAQEGKGDWAADNQKSCKEGATICANPASVRGNQGSSMMGLVKRSNKDDSPSLLFGCERNNIVLVVTVVVVVVMDDDLREDEGAKDDALWTDTSMIQRIDKLTLKRFIVAR